jgi:hypothetical protein
VDTLIEVFPLAIKGADTRKKESFNFFGLPGNVVENKGPEMRKMRQMRTPRNVFENK